MVFWNTWEVSALRHVEGANDSIIEIKSLMRSHHIDSDTENPLVASGYLDDRISGTWVYGENRISEVELKVGKIQNDLADFGNR